MNGARRTAHQEDPFHVMITVQYLVAGPLLVAAQVPIRAPVPLGKVSPPWVGYGGRGRGWGAGQTRFIASFTAVGSA